VKTFVENLAIVAGLGGGTMGFIGAGYWISGMGPGFFFGGLGLFAFHFLLNHLAEKL
jgi:hypothetical protein